MTLNEQAQQLADTLEHDANRLRIQVHSINGARILDCGISAQGGLRAGVALARACLADQAEVTITPGMMAEIPNPQVQVITDDPIRACMASQYAGWQVQVGKFFAMGSGPMRAKYGQEALFERIGQREQAEVAVGVFETRKLPTEEVIAYLSERLALPAGQLTLLCAPAASVAGTVQVVARALETALHKLDELHFDLTQVVSGYGIAPLPPVHPDEIGAIGWTNDAILYGGRVTLWVRTAKDKAHELDERVAEVGPKVPSSSSAAHGQPFRVIFEQAGRDFYAIDPHLFSPAVLTIHNLTSGRSFTFGRLEPAVLSRSFTEV